MFPSVAKDEPLKQKIRQKHWDDRFGAKGTIPQYSPLKDKHAKSYRKIITHKKDQHDLQSKPIKATYFQKRLELVQQLNKIHKSNTNQIQEFEQLAGKYKLPNFYIYYTLLPLLSPTISITQYLFQQRKSIKEQASHYHKIVTAIRARAQCLERLRKTLAEMAQQKLQASRNELKVEIQHLRILTQNAIDSIKKWRDSLGKIEERAIYYTDAQQNYLIKILNDNKFIFSSKLNGALAFGEKNDPFLLVPVKRGQGKEASMFSDIIKLSKDYSHYQKYMEYLAGQKAYELSINTPVKQQPIGYHSPSVEKVYKSNNSKPDATILKETQQEDGYKKMQILKVREDRLKKNQQKIKQIKQIYESYGRKNEEKTEKHTRAEHKMPQTDNEDKRGQKRRSQSIKVFKQDTSDFEFQYLVKGKLKAEQSDKFQKTKTHLGKQAHSKSSSKLPTKSQEKMIESLRDIQSTLRNKLQVIQQEQKNQSASSLLSSTQQKFNRKTNEEIVKQLKAEILSKIQKEGTEKDRLKKLKREQQQKALEQVKVKLKKEMQEKLQQKKKEKILERQQLQKKLKSEQERLTGQRQLELQLQLKLNKEKQLRQLQKIRRQGLEREKKYKQQLEKQKLLRKSQEGAIQREIREKQRLLEQLRKKQLKEQIEDQLRTQMKVGKSSKQDSKDFLQQEFLRSQKEAQLVKQIEQLKMKEGVQMHQLKKQNQLRQKMLKLKREEEDLKRKQIQHLMRTAVQREKSELEQDAINQRVELQERMRANVKEKLLQDYKHQKQAQILKIKHEREKQLQQQVYREKIRDKIQKQMRIQAIQRTKKQLEDRQTKKYQARSKLQQIKSKFDKQIVIDKVTISEDVKKEMVEKIIFDKQAEKEAAKYDLRMQFEKQLMASAIPQMYQSKDSFLIKNINYFQGDMHLNSKLQDLRPTNQKPVESPIKQQERGKVKPLIDSMTNQQLEVYEKQKEKVSEIKEEKVIVPSRVPQEDQGFQKLNIQRTHKAQEEYQSKIIPIKKSPKKQQKQKHHSKKKKKKQSSQDSQEEVKQKKHRKKKKRQYYEQESDGSEEKAKKKKKHKKRKQSSQSQSSSDIEEKKSPIKTISKLQNETNKFKYQEQKPSKLQKPSSKKQLKNPIQRQPSGKSAVVHFDAQNKSNFNKIEPVTIKPQKIASTAQKFKISLQAIPQAEFDQYLEVHFSSMTPLQIIIQLFNRQQLYRKLIGELTFCLLVGMFEGRVVGQALAYHDRTRADIRKFTIIHMATYKDQDLKDFILSLQNFIFRKDPCDQIQFHYKFNEGDNEQLEFSQNFNKWFDKYGSVFQKKVDQSLYERKYALKRQFNQKCQVVLGGVNKNIFRNLFSVYCGVLMSDTDMKQFKQELIGTLAPQNQICYSIMVSELFRTYLSPDQAQTLKNKVKEYVKLKEMLILVVSMQKKKLKLDQLKLYEYKNLIELNMRLMSQGKDIIRYCKDTNAQINRIYYAELNNSFNLPFHFQTTSLPVEANHEGQIRQISYFRLSPLPPFKLHIVKSSLYNAEMNILPTENSKYKIFVINAQEYNQIKETNHLDLFLYIRLFLKNVKSHNVAVWKYVWLPEMTDKGAWNLRQYKNFFNKDFYAHDYISISYRQFLPGALIIQPDHRDLVLTPPFIVGVMSMSLEQVSEGSPLYARLIDINALKTIEIEKS